MWHLACKKVALTAVAFAVAFVVADSTLRVFVHLVPGPLSAERVLFEFDPAIQAIRHRQESGAMVNWRGTKPHWVSFNSFGCRGKYPKSIKKPDGVVRIICLGGSSTEDAYVADGLSWPELLQEKLNAKLGTNKVEVINFGCSGYTTGASVRNLATYGLRFEPDIVIVYHANNDFLHEFRRRGCTLDSAAFDYEKHRRTWLGRLLTKSIILDRVNRWLFYRNGTRLRNFLLERWTLADEHKTGADMTGVEDPARRELDTLVGMSETHGFKLVVGLQATLIKPTLSEDEVLRMWEILPLMSAGKPVKWSVFTDGLQRIKEMQRHAAATHGLLCIDVEASVAKTTDNFIDHIHSTERGSERIAEAFAQGLLSARGVKP